MARTELKQPNHDERRKHDAIHHLHTIYTDGGTSRKRAAWAYSIRNEQSAYWQDAGAVNVDEYTSQRAELYAAIRALSAVPWTAHITLHSDSQYLVYGMSKWIFEWLNHGWRNREGKPVRNQDVLKELHRLAPLGDSEREVEWVRIQWGSDEGIRRVDQLVQHVLCSGRMGSKRSRLARSIND